MNKTVTVLNWPNRICEGTEQIQKTMLTADHVVQISRSKERSKDDGKYHQ